MEFSYLGPLIAENGRIDAEVDKRIANASKAFGALRQAVFKDAHLSINTKRKVYQACVLSVLMYGHWWRMLNTFEETFEDEHPPSQMRTHSAWDHKQKAMGRAHLLREGERAMGRCRNHHRKVNEEKVGVVGSPCSNT